MERELDVSMLIALPESEYLDRKREYHKNNVQLVHDILCLCNAYSESHRYLLFGINDDGSVAGVESDSNRKTNAGFQDLIRQAKFNRLPTVSLESHDYDGHVVDVLTIRNRPDKPFYLTRDKREGKVTIRAGVVYTRVGDTNVPLKECAPDEMVELMWRERFGLAMHPLARFELLLENPQAWIPVEGDAYIYNQEFPEFVLRRGDIVTDDFREPWTQRLPDPTAHSYYVHLEYFGTVLRKYVFVSCDGGRYQIPLPDRQPDGSYILRTGSPEYRIAKIYWQYLPLQDGLYTVGLVDD